MTRSAASAAFDLGASAAATAPPSDVVCAFVVVGGGGFSVCGSRGGRQW